MNSGIVQGILGAGMLVMGLVWAQNQSDLPQAGDILERMAQKYATLQTYQDEGVVISKAPIRGRKTPFTIHFKNPNLFRMQWNTIHAVQPFQMRRFDYEVRSDGHHVWFRQPQEATYQIRPTLPGALAEAAGPSSGSAHTIPSLLIDSMQGFSLLDLTNPSVIGREMFEDTSCWVIQGDHPSAEKWTYTLWIGVADDLLRKMDFKLGEEVHRNIRTDEPIDETVFAAPRGG